MAKSIQVLQQEIRSLIQNFQWETDPEWQAKMVEIDAKIKDYWENYLKRKYIIKYGA